MNHPAFALHDACYSGPKDGAVIPELKVLRVGESRPAFGRLNEPDLARDYWFLHVVRAAWFDPDKEALVVLLLNSKLGSIGFNLVSMGTLNESLAHPRDRWCRRSLLSVQVAA